MSLKNPLRPDDQLYYIHVPKCAGTSFISLVDEHFVTNEINPDHYDLGAVRKYSDKFMRQLRFIRGHLPYDLIVPRLPKPPRIITILREPVTRFISNINMRQRVDDPLSGLREMLEKLSLDGVLEKPELVRVFANRATRLVGGITKNKNNQIVPNLSLAKERLAAFEFIGIVEHFDESLDHFSYIFDFHPFRTNRRLNVSPDKEKRDLIDEKTLAKVREIEYADLALYEYAIELFKQQTREIQNERKKAKKTYYDLIGDRFTFDFKRVNPGVGWHVAETHPLFGTLRWSGPENKSYLYFPLAPKDWKVGIVIANAIQKELEKTLELRVNGHQVELTARRKLLGWEFEGHIPSGVFGVNGGLAEVELQIEKTSKPGNGVDARLLGLQYQGIQFTPAER